MMAITLRGIEHAYASIAGLIHKTPIITSSQIDKLAGCEVFFKCEHLQKTGSFKSRGASYSVTLLKEDKDVKGVITHSSGNHGQGLAWAAKQVGLPCLVVVPNATPQTKIDAMLEYDAEIVLCENSMKAREDECNNLAQKMNYAIVPPFDSPSTIHGQGTIALELMEQLPNLDAIFLSVGGGGMATGIAKYMGEKFPNVKVFLVEPDGKHLGQYLKTGNFDGGQESLKTIADGIRVHKIGSYCFPILKQFCQENVISVSENEIADAIKLIWTRTKQRVEPASAVPLAGLMKSNTKALGIKKVGVILCGGNVDCEFIPNP